MAELKILKRPINPFKRLISTKRFRDARALRRSFDFKKTCRDAFFFFNGQIAPHYNHTIQPSGQLTHTLKPRYFGILDYLFFPLSLLSYKCMNSSERHNSGFLFVLSLIIGSPKHLASCVATFLSLPFIAIAQKISKTKALKLTNNINNAPAPSQSTVTILTHLQAQAAQVQAPRMADILDKYNFAELVKDQNGNTTGFTLYIDLPNNARINPSTYPNDVLDFQGNIIHRAGDIVQIYPAVTFIKSQLNADQLKAMKAIRKLNIGGVQTLIEAEEKAGKSGLTL